MQKIKPKASLKIIFLISEFIYPSCFSILIVLIFKVAKELKLYSVPIINKNNKSIKLPEKADVK